MDPQTVSLRHGQAAILSAGQGGEPVPLRASTPHPALPMVFAETSDTPVCDPSGGVQNVVLSHTVWTGYFYL